jgi:hypothetical protein
VEEGVVGLAWKVVWRCLLLLRSPADLLFLALLKTLPWGVIRWLGDGEEALSSTSHGQVTGPVVAPTTQLMGGLCCWKEGEVDVGSATREENSGECMLGSSV